MEKEVICIEVDTDTIRNGKRIAVYRVDEKLPSERIELTLEEAVYLTKNLADLIQSMSDT